MLSKSKVAEIADQVLRRTLGQHGYDHAEVRFGDDHDGAPSIFIDAFFREGSDATPGQATLTSITGLSSAFRGQGEDRFPYFRARFVGDEIGVE
ncbi:hypothetical protein [Chenggangzhangella methanolivorans]|uniref:Uncharacterized protein n=1 Tax=Chenggangzhangella methanolivorans TaxID=1437009 RepID=A0A9E6UQ54_9HYPH|nr:hypothetical protein [Chenggangzhangella methanolivorans]QZO02194.1 hypothetical protein K6K41_13665 [Chenggangzhangella methanolivorans]